MASDDTDPTPPTSGRRGRSLRDPAPGSAAASTDVGDDFDDLEDIEAGAPPRRHAAPARAPMTLVWNRAGGIRPGIISKPTGIGPGGQQLFTTRSVYLVPGLNLVPQDDWAELSDPSKGNLADRIADREVLGFGADMAAVRPRALVAAIEKTATEAPLLWIAERQRGAPAEVIAAVDRQLAEISQGAGSRLEHRSVVA